MPVRQYVGARYVPKFYQNSQGNGATWESNTPYEALTIVTYNNNSYTSKISVPENIGAPNQNSQYWVLTGNYNAQVEEYRSQTESLQNNVSTNTSNIIKSTSMQGRNIIFIGDSFGTIKTNGRTMFDICANLLGVTEYKQVSVSSRGFTTSLENPANFLGELQSIDTIKTNVTDIVVMGGPNDVSSNANAIDNAINNFCSWAHNNYINANIWIGFEGRHWSDEYHDKSINTVLPAYKNCTNHNALYLNGIDNVLHSTTNLISDALHPSDSGVQKLGIALANCLNGSYPDTYELIQRQASDYKIGDSFSAIDTFMGESECINGDNVIIGGAGGGVISLTVKDAPKAFTGQVEIAHFDVNIAQTYIGTLPLSSVTTLIGTKNDNTVEYVPVIFTKSGNKIIFQPYTATAEYKEVKILVPNMTIPASIC